MKETAPWKISFIVMFTSFMLLMLFFSLLIHSLTYFVSWWFPLFGIFRFCFGNGKFLYSSSWGSIYFRYFFFLLSFFFQVTSYWLCSVRTMFNVHGIEGKLFLSTRNSIFILFNLDFPLTNLYFKLHFEPIHSHIYFGLRCPKTNTPKMM